MGTKRPVGLKRSGKRLWDQLQARYEWDQVEEELQPLAVCRTVDRLDELHDLIGKEGLQLADGRVNPLLVESRLQADALTRLVHGLRLPDEAGARPQRRGGPRGPYKLWAIK